MQKQYEIKLVSGSVITISGWCAPNAIENSGYNRCDIEWCKPV